MNCTILPSIARGVVTAPPSKSAAHRLLICAALAEGESEISNLPTSEDVLATVDCLRALGAEIRVENSRSLIRGIPLPPQTGPALLPCRESGSTLRFLLPLALWSGRETVFTGSERLFQRPLSVYEELFWKQNCLFERGENRLRVWGSLRPGRFAIPGNISSQFTTGLLFALPLLDGESRLCVLPPVQSRPYAELTLDILALFGVKIDRQDAWTFRIPGNQRCLPRSCAVEGDWSNAAFLDALNLLGGEIQVNGLDPQSRQGDKVYPELFHRLRSGYSEIDLSDCPDLGPILFALAAELHGASFTGIRRLRCKESDRCQAMRDELSKFGATLRMEDDRVELRPAALHRPSAPLNAHNDHRVAMALAVLMTRYGGTLTGAEAVRKSFPAFYTALQSLGVTVFCQINSDF